MHLVADGVGESLPAVPVVFVATVFDGVDRVFFGEFFKVCCLLLRVALCAAFTFELRVVIDTVFEELGGCTVESECDVATDLVASCFNCLCECVEGIFCAVELRCETAFVTYSCAEATIVENLLEAVEALSTHADGFAECSGTDWADHELLECDRCVGVRATVDNIHHRHG